MTGGIVHLLTRVNVSVIHALITRWIWIILTRCNRFWSFASLWQLLRQRTSKSALWWEISTKHMFFCVHGSQMDLRDVAATRNVAEGEFYKILSKHVFCRQILTPKRCLVRTCCKFCLPRESRWYWWPLLQDHIISWKRSCVERGYVYSLNCWNHFLLRLCHVEIL